MLWDANWCSVIVIVIYNYHNLFGGLISNPVGETTVKMDDKNEIGSMYV